MKTARFFPLLSIITVSQVQLSLSNDTNNIFYSATFHPQKFFGWRDKAAKSSSWEEWYQFICEYDVFNCLFITICKSQPSVFVSRAVKQSFCKYRLITHHSANTSLFASDENSIANKSVRICFVHGIRGFFFVKSFE